MPYTVKKQACEQADGTKGTHVLIKDATGEVVSCHTSKADADAAMRARMANEPSTMSKACADLYSVLNVEIFAAGTHNGDTYTEADLDEMIAAEKQVGFAAPLKDGHHNDDPGYPALGWVKNLRRSGTTLLADFLEMPKAVYEAIVGRRYDRLSSEIYWNYTADNVPLLPRVLKAVALLGAEIPAIPSLKPLREVVVASQAIVSKRYEVSVERSTMTKCVCFQLGLLADEETPALYVVAFPSYEWSLSDARAWLAAQGLSAATLDEEHDEYRFIQRPHEDFVRDSLRTVTNWVRPTGDGAPEDVMVMYSRTGGTTMEKKAGATDPGTEDLKALGAQVAALSAKLDTLSTPKSTTQPPAASGATDTSVKVLSEQISDLTARITRLAHEHDQTKAQLAEAEGKARRERITRKVEACQVPAFRPFIQAFYDLATETDGKTVKVYDAEKKAQADKLAESVVDELVAHLAKFSKTLFATQSRTDETPRAEGDEHDDPAAEVDRRVKIFMAKNPSVKYGDAQKAVFAEDPALKEQYAAAR